MSTAPSPRQVASLQRLVEHLAANNVRIRFPQDEIVRGEIAHAETESAGDEAGSDTTSSELANDNSVAVTEQQGEEVEASNNELASAISAALAEMGIIFDEPMIIPPSSESVGGSLAPITINQPAPPPPPPIIISPASIPIPSLVESGAFEQGTAVIGTYGAPGGPVPASPPVSAPPAPASSPAAAAASTPVTGFVCPVCNTHNVIRSAKETWYAVTIGRQVGVFQGWYVTALYDNRQLEVDGNFVNRHRSHQTQHLVSGVPNAFRRKYASREDALAAFEEALALGAVSSTG